MQYRARDYVDSVLSRVDADEQTLARLREDLLAHIEEASEGEGVEAVIRRMGRPEAVARELREHLQLGEDNLAMQLRQARAALRRLAGYEYRSKATLFGLPLVHVNLTRGRGGRIRVAKGILAIGDVAMGIVAVGGLAFGLIGFGGLAFGLLLALGGVAAGGFSLGGLSIGYYALGGCAIGIYAFGGAAIALRVAVGGFASATVAVGARTSGQYVIEHGAGGLRYAEVSAQAVRALILEAYPNTEAWLLRLMTLPFR